MYLIPGEVTTPRAAVRPMSTERDAVSSGRRPKAPGTGGVLVFGVAVVV